MRSKIAQRILEETPPHTKIYVDMLTEIMLRINSLVIQKRQTEDISSLEVVNKWLNNDLDMSLVNIAKLEAELGAPIIKVTKSN